MAAKVTGWCSATALACRSPVGMAARKLAAAPMTTDVARPRRATSRCLPWSTQSALTDAMVKQPVMTAPVIVCRYWGSAHGLLSSAHRLSRSRRPSTIS